VTDPDWSNDAQPHSGTWRQFFTCTREEFLDEFVHPDDRPAVEEARQKRALQVRAEYLTEMRKKAGLTQAGVAEAIDVSQQRVSAIESGSVAELATLADREQALASMESTGRAVQKQERPGYNIGLR